MTYQIPLVDLKNQYHVIKNEIDEALGEVFEKGHFSEGTSVQKFEKEFANLHNVKHCTGICNGTAALHTILLAFGIGMNDEVIVPANTCFPTITAVKLTGASATFVDCEQTYYNIDPSLLEESINVNTKAILVVHLYGQPAQMCQIQHIAEKHNLYLIEDCAHAHLATYDGNLVGNFGAAAAFSFYPTKNLGACGEGGAVVTNDDNLPDRIRAFKNHGSYEKNIHEFIGHNYRMDSLQAAVLTVKLQHLENWTTIRQKNAANYVEQLSDIEDLYLPKQKTNTRHAFHLFVIRTTKRVALQRYLKQCGIETAVHYPVPCHLQPALHHLQYKKGDFPISEMLSEQILSLPVAEHVSEDDVSYVSECIRKFYSGK